MSQTNTQIGTIPVITADDLTGKLGYLVKFKDASGVLNCALPTANTDLALFLVDEEAEADERAAIQPLSPDRNVRIKLKGTCVPGDVLVLADVATAADAGKVRKLPETPGTYRGIAIAEEAGVDTQLVLARPALIGYITIVA